MNVYGDILWVRFAIAPCNNVKVLILRRTSGSLHYIYLISGMSLNANKEKLKVRKRTLSNSNLRNINVIKLNKTYINRLLYNRSRVMMILGTRGRKITQKNCSNRGRSNWRENSFNGLSRVTVRVGPHRVIAHKVMAIFLSLHGLSAIMFDEKIYEERLYASHAVYTHWDTFQHLSTGFSCPTT